ncbi:hypothetical protein B0H13DRAFT_2310621 [Mycena leptocephala]|nr:hypothetical protein B0H13DRAFT_2310621 [Mycena leptocephala]
MPAAPRAWEHLRPPPQMASYAAGILGAVDVRSLLADPKLLKAVSYWTIEGHGAIRISVGRRPEASTAQLQASPLVQIVPFQEGDDNENGEAALLRRFDVDGADAYELLGYEDEDNEEDTAVGTRGDVGSSESSSSSDDDEEGDTHWTTEQKKAFRIRTCVDAAKRTEGNRRAGGRKTQNAMVRAWNEFTQNALAAGQIDDTIVDEHALLLYIKFCAERPKRTRKGVEIPSAFGGASHLKKLLSGALRIRKEQDAANPALAAKRPAVVERRGGERKSR